MEMQEIERRKQKSLSIDRLSELPDAILCHILSFLPTKTSVATSILSIRWRFLWAYVPNLYFDCGENQQIIDRVLVLHKLPNLKSLIIDLQDYDSDEFQVQTWISAAIERNVRYLKLDVDYHKYLPCRLFTLENLVDLRLYECGKIPTIDDVRLPRLNKLYLKCVGFKDHQSLPRLLSGSPVLQYFRFESDMDFNLRSCYISSSTVKWLCLESLVGSLGPRDKGHRLEINTPALEYLSVHDYLSGPIEFGNLRFLIAADIYHQDDDIEEDQVLCCQSLLKFVDSLSNVKCLKLDLSDYATIVDTVFSAWNPSFNNLTKLELMAEPRFLSMFLENANNLEILEFWKPKQCQFRNTKGWINPKQVPKCLLSSLRTIKVGNIVGSLKIVRYLMRNAKVLKRMDIVYPQRIDAKEKNDLLQKISLSKRGSEACELAFTEATHKDSFGGGGTWKGISPKGLPFSKSYQDS